MLDRFNPSDLIQGLASGLRKRRHLHDEDSEEKADWSSRIILVGLPAAVAVLICVFRWEFTGADQILAGAALLCGSLLAAFAQIAVRAEIHQREFIRFRDGHLGPKTICIGPIWNPDYLPWARQGVRRDEAAIDLHGSGP